VNRNQAQGTSGAGPSSSISAPSVATHVGPMTPEMLMQAIFSSNLPSLGAVPLIGPAGGSAPSQQEPVPPAAGGGSIGQTPMCRDWGEALAQMRGLGLNDEALCVQALEATDGDLEAAIEIIFAGNANP